MKVRLAILEKDRNYLNRIVSVFSTKYADRLEVYSFTEEQRAIDAVNESKLNVLIAGESFSEVAGKIPQRCGFAYLVEAGDIQTYNNHRAICKFQKADLIYRQVLSIYAETAGNITGIKFDDDNCKVIAFGSAGGGTGSSSMAAAAAINLAASGKKTLYLNLEKLGTADRFFHSPGQFDMSDIIFALKSKKSNISLKLESCVKQDATGVYFYSGAKVALDMIDLKEEEILRMIQELRMTGTYDCIVLDLDFGVESKLLDLYQTVGTLVMVTDGSEGANLKLQRAYEALSILEKNRDTSITGRMAVIYNKFSGGNCEILDNPELKKIGTVPQYEYSSTTQLINKLAETAFFKQIF